MEESRVKPLLLYLLRDQRALTAPCYWGMLGDYLWGRGSCGHESALAGLNAAVRRPGPAMRFPPLRHRHRQDYTAFKWAAAAGNGARGTPVAAATWAMICRAINLAGEISADLSSPTNEAVKLLLHLHVSLDESGWQEQDARRRHLGLNAAHTHARRRASDPANQEQRSLQELQLFWKTDKVLEKSELLLFTFNTDVWARVEPQAGVFITQRHNKL